MGITAPFSSQYTNAVQSLTASRGKPIEHTAPGVVGVDGTGGFVGVATGAADGELGATTGGGVVGESVGVVGAMGGLVVPT